MKTSNLSLSTNEALLLQSIHEQGSDDVRSLASQLHLSRQHVIILITSLREKGLVRVDADSVGIWTYLTNKGNNLMRSLWPEAHGAFA